MRTKKPVRAKKSAPPSYQARAIQIASRVRRTIVAQPVSVQATAAAAICIFGIAILIGTGKPSDPADAAAAPAVAVADKAMAANVPAVESPIGVEAERGEAFPKAEPVTITGCLEQSNDAFRLKDTAGEDAPKSRSWKSGFLKKRSSPIDVVDSGRRLKLPAHVGERVSVTGVMMNREMQARSLQRVAAACN